MTRAFQTGRNHRIPEWHRHHLRHGLLVLEDRRLEAPLEAVPGALVGPTEPHGVGQRPPRDGAAEVRIPGTEEEMVMVVHQHERVHRHREAPGEFGKPAEEAAPIVVRAEDASAAIASVDDMVPAMGHPWREAVEPSSDRPGAPRIVNS